MCDMDDHGELVLWHGGAAGLRVGDFVVPRCELPSDSIEHVLSSRNDPTDTARVYVTGLKRMAYGFAVRFANSPGRGSRLGALYRVRAVGEMVPDPDFPERARCWSVKRAEVVSIEEAQVRDKQTVANREIGKFATWNDGAWVYTPQGYLTAAPEWVEHGVTDSELRRFGKWASFDDLGWNRHTRRMERVPESLLVY